MKKLIKKITAISICFILLFGIGFNFMPEASATLVGGKCGDNLNWELSSDGVLSFEGSGKTYDWDNDEIIPWDEYASQITSVEIPGTVTGFGLSSFFNCTEIKKVNFNGTIEQWLNIDFSYGINPVFWSENLYIQNELLENLVIPDTVTEIKDYAFYCCKSIKTLEIPNGVEKIGESAFEYCSGIKKLILPESITELGMGAFTRCSFEYVSVSSNIRVTFEQPFCDSYIRNVELKSGVETIGRNFFENCEILNIDVPENFTSQEEWIFSDVVNVNYNGDSKEAPWGARCLNGLIDGNFVYEDDTKTVLCGADINTTGDVVLPESVKVIGDSAFAACEGISSIKLPDSLEVIGDMAFWACKGIEEIDIPENVKEIGAQAFGVCTNLCNLTLPKNIDRISEACFWSCDSLSFVELPSSIKSIDKNAFSDCYSLDIIYYDGRLTDWLNINKQDFDIGFIDGLKEAEIFCRFNDGMVGYKQLNVFNRTFYIMSFCQNVNPLIGIWDIITNLPKMLSGK